MPGVRAWLVAERLRVGGVSAAQRRNSRCHACRHGLRTQFKSVSMLQVHSAAAAQSSRCNTCKHHLQRTQAIGSKGA